MIVGLDLSYSSTGLCVDGALSTFGVKPGADEAERLVLLRNGLLERIGTPDMVIMEGFSFASAASRAHAAGGLGWIVRVALHEHRIPYVVVPPSNLKRYATGKGNANKSVVVSAVSARTGIEFKADDECDAWVLWQMGLAHYHPAHAALVQMPQTHLTGLDKIEWRLMP